MNNNQQLNSFADSFVTPVKPIGSVLTGKARRQVRRIPLFSDPCDYSPDYFPL